jgi:hypothetical protein
MLAHALLREDAGFHTYQMLEAGVRQFRDWGDGAQGRISSSPLLGTWLPIFRLLADIARRLMRGGELHREAQVAG